MNKNGLDISISHLNARSLYGSFGKFKQLLGLLDHEFSVIGISETWLNDSTLELGPVARSLVSANPNHALSNPGLVDIPGYNFVSNHG